MAILTITEHRNIGSIGTNKVPLVSMPGLVEQPGIAIGGSSTPSQVFSSHTHAVRVNCDIACCLAWSTNSTPPTAVINQQRWSPGETAYIEVHPGGMLAVIASPT